MQNKKYNILYYLYLYHFKNNTFITQLLWAVKIYISWKCSPIYDLVYKNIKRDVVIAVTFIKYILSKTPNCLHNTPYTIKIFRQICRTVIYCAYNILYIISTINKDTPL